LIKAQKIHSGALTMVVDPGGGCQSRRSNAKVIGQTRFRKVSPRRYCRVAGILLLNAADLLKNVGITGPDSVSRAIVQ
jgi:hypothetical protein